MLAFGLAVLTLFSLAGLFAGSEDPRQGGDPRDDTMFSIWYRLR